MVEKINSEQPIVTHRSALGAQDIANILDESTIRKQCMQKRIDGMKSFQFQFIKDEKEKWEKIDIFDSILDEIIDKIPMTIENKNHYYTFGDLTVCVDDIMGITLGDLKSISFYSKKKLCDLPSYQRYHNRVQGTVIDDKDLFMLLHEISKLDGVSDFIDGKELYMYPNIFINNDSNIEQKDDRKRLLNVLRWFYIITGYTGRIPFNFDNNSSDSIDTLSVRPNFVGYVRSNDDQDELRFIMKKNV